MACDVTNVNQEVIVTTSTEDPEQEDMGASQLQRPALSIPHRASSSSVPTNPLPASNAKTVTQINASLSMPPTLVFSGDVGENGQPCYRVMCSSRPTAVSSTQKLSPGNTAARTIPSTAAQTIPPAPVRDIKVVNPPGIANTAYKTGMISVPKISSLHNGNIALADSSATNRVWSPKTLTLPKGIMHSKDKQSISVFSVTKITSVTASSKVAIKPECGSRQVQEQRALVMPSAQPSLSRQSPVEANRALKMKLVPLTKCETPSVVSLQGLDAENVTRGAQLSSPRTIANILRRKAISAKDPATVTVESSNALESKPIIRILNRGGSTMAGNILCRQQNSTKGTAVETAKESSNTMLQASSTSGGETPVTDIFRRGVNCIKATMATASKGSSQFPQTNSTAEESLRRIGNVHRNNYPVEVGGVQDGPVKVKEENILMPIITSVVSLAGQNYFPGEDTMPVVEIKKHKKKKKKKKRQAAETSKKGLAVEAHTKSSGSSESMLPAKHTSKASRKVPTKSCKPGDSKQEPCRALSTPTSMAAPAVTVSHIGKPKSDEDGLVREDVVEVCTFQTLKGYPVMGSKIMFKPTAQPECQVGGNGPESKAQLLEKLKQAITRFEESAFSGDTFTSEEKGLLQSVFSRIKADPAILSASEDHGEGLKKAADSSTRTCDPKRSLEQEPEQDMAPDKHSWKQDKVPVGTCSSASSLVSKSEGEENEKAVKNPPKMPVIIALKQALDQSPPSSVPTMNLPIVAPKKPLRRIVITSDVIPTLKSGEIKCGIEKFLNKNNISNYFANDELLNLHWNGKDINTLHFKDGKGIVARESAASSPTCPTSKPSNIAPTPTTLRQFRPARSCSSVVPSGKQQHPTQYNNLSQTEKSKSTAWPTQQTHPGSHPQSILTIKRSTGENETVVLSASNADGLHKASADGLTALPGTQLGFRPRAVRLVKSNGEVVEQRFVASQGTLPILPAMSTAFGKPGPPTVPSGAMLKQPNGKMGMQLVPTTSSSAGSLMAPEALTQLIHDVMSKSGSKNMQSQNVTVRYLMQGQTSGETTTRKTSTGPIHIVKLTPTKAAEVLERTKLGAIPPQAKPESAESSDEDELRTIFEPEVLLEESNTVLEVGSATESDSDSDDSDSDDSDLYVPMKKMRRAWSVQLRKPAKRHKAPLPKRKRRKTRPRLPQAKVSTTRRRVIESDLKVCCTNCIDTPCIVEMDHLNDRLLQKGFLNLSKVSKKDLFVVHDTTVVTLCEGKTISVLKRSSPVYPVTDSSKPQKPSPDQEDPSDDLLQMLMDRRRQLEALRSKYSKDSRK